MLAIFLLLVGARSASATVGGEWLCEVLGYEPSTRRVYVHQLDGSGASSFGSVAWMAITGEGAGALHGVEWNPSGENTADDPAPNRRLAALRAKLKPLHRLTWPSLPFAQKVVARDSIANEMGVRNRLRVCASFASRFDLEVTCWGSPTVARPAVYELPEGKGHLWVIGFIGNAFEGGYETQMPLLVKPGETGTRLVEWRRPVD